MAAGAAGALAVAARLLGCWAHCGAGPLRRVIWAAGEAAGVQELTLQLLLLIWPVVVAAAAAAVPFRV